MQETDLASWMNFYVASAGAAAALAGLVFVSMSINLARILAIPGLPGRGAETLILLAATLAVSLIALIPGQSSFVPGVELSVVALLA